MLDVGKMQLMTRDYRLTNRELECLILAFYGQSSKEIGRKMGVSHRTVEVFLSNLKQKFSCRTRLQLVSKLVQILMSSDSVEFLKDL